MTKAINSFAVEIPSRDTDPNLFYKKELLALIAEKYPQFTVSGKNPPAIRRGVEYASHGNLLTFGTSKTHDVEWVERTGYACEKGYAPVYNLVKYWKAITNRLNDLYNEKYPAKMRLSNGTEVEFFDNFVKVGYKRVSYADIRTAKVEALNIFFSNRDIEAMYFSLVR